MSETRDVVRPTLDLLNGIPGVYAFRIHSGRVKVRRGYMHLAAPGTPDIGAVVRGVPVFFECKSARGRVSDEQREAHYRISRAGGSVVVVKRPSAAVDVVRNILSMLEPMKGGPAL